jgi:hypothetical protein
MARKRGRSIEERIVDQVKRRNEGGGDFRPMLDMKMLEEPAPIYKVEKGKQKISILPYVVSSENHPDLEIDDMDYKLQVWVHQGVGVNNDAVLCLNKTYGKACPICEERKRLMDSGKEWDDQEVSDCSASKRVWYNVEIPGSEEKGIHIMNKMSWKYFEKRMCATAEEDYEEIVIFASLKDGAIVNFKAVEESFGKIKYFNFENFSLDARPAMSEDRLDEVYPLDAMLIVPTYDDVYNLFHGGEADAPVPDDEEEEDAEERKPAAKAKPKLKAKPGKSAPPIRKKKAEPKEEMSADEDEDTDPNRCPYGYIFGKDCNTQDGCSECEEETFGECIDLQETMAAEEEPAPKAPKKRVLKRKS